MEKLSDRATKIFTRLVELVEMAPEKAMTINNNDAFMALSIENIGKAEINGLLPFVRYSLAHYYVQNGDMMRDPEMTFLCYSKDGITLVYPESFRNDGAGVDVAAAICETDTIKYNKTEQKKQATFANQWLENIQMQQEI